MSRVNRGKDFEQEIRQAFEKVPDTSVIRLLDPQNGFAGVRNICDFIVYHYPVQYLVECKTCYGNTLPFSNITANQWSGMLEMSKIAGIRAGVVVWFIDHDTTMWIDIRLLEQLKSEGKKSIHWYSELWPEDMWTYINGEKRRVMFDYNMTSFFKEITYGTD